MYVPHSFGISILFVTECQLLSTIDKAQSLTVPGLGSLGVEKVWNIDQHVKIYCGNSNMSSKSSGLEDNYAASAHLLMSITSKGRLARLSSEWRTSSCRNDF
jgi:hypothetical protein